MRSELPETVVIGIITKAHGVKGAVKIRPLTHYPPRFKQLKSVLLEHPEGEVLQYGLSHVSFRGEYVYVFFEGIDTREQAQTLKGASVQIKKEQALPLEDDEFYPFEIAGFEVKTVSGERLGYVEEVMDLAANAVLVVRDQEQEYLVPVIKDVICELDMKAGTIIIQPLEGLLE